MVIEQRGLSFRYCSWLEANNKDALGIHNVLWGGASTRNAGNAAQHLSELSWQPQRKPFILNLFIVVVRQMSKQRMY